MRVAAFFRGFLQEELNLFQLVRIAPVAFIAIRTM
jgi:hypothetical protein